MPKTISKDTPLAEITLRRYEKPVDLSGRDLARKICLSLGLLQPGDSRDVVVDVLDVLLRAKEDLSSQQVEESVIESRKKHKLPLQGIAGSNIRRQLKRLKDLLIIESTKSKYHRTEHLSLSEIFTEKIEKFYLENITSRVKEYLAQVK